MTTRRHMLSAASVPLEKGPNGRNLCRWCKTECAKKQQTFCSKLCVFEWRIRVNPSDMRKAVLARDNGICAICKIDTIAQALELALLRRKSGDAIWRARCDELSIPKNRRGKTLWDADHIVPVVAGGGSCGLQNMRTLCLACHRQQTKQLMEKVNQKHTK